MDNEQATVHRFVGGATTVDERDDDHPDSGTVGAGRRGGSGGFCDVTSFHFASGWFAGLPGMGSAAVTHATESLHPYLTASLGRCEEVAVGFQLNAVITCATLAFAAIGQGNRMRFSADCPVQKALGMLTDTLGAVTLTGTMVSFGTACYRDVPRAWEDVRAEVALA